jgi:membrane-associated phospholipid phosphatase
MELQTLDRPLNASPPTRHQLGPGSLAALALLGVVFVALSAVCFHRVGPTALDTFLLNGYRPSRISLLFRGANVITGFGSPGAVIVLGCVTASLLWWRFRSTQWAVASVLAPALAGASEATLKVIVGRPRPVTAVLTGESGNGFPSGHTAGFAALVFIVAFALLDLWGRHVPRNRMLGVASVATAAMAVTRVVVGAHYPSDVIAGAIIGYVAARIVSHAALHPATVQRLTNQWRHLPSRTDRSR